MEKQTILQEIFLIEKKLSEVSLKVKQAEVFASIDLWIEHVLKSDLQLANHFAIPTAERIRKALLTLITTNSPLTMPILNLLSTRIASYIAIIDDLKPHPMIGPAASSILDDFLPLVSLVHKYDIHFEQNKSIQLIRQALESNRLHIYQSYSKEPHLRIVLKTLQLDKSRDDKESVQYLLNFLFDQLKQNILQKGFILQPRHGWWALLDLMEESDPEWLLQNHDDLNEILQSFLRATEYVPTTDPTSVVPEMNSTYNEEIWVTINMMRFYKTSIDKFVPAETMALLRTRIESNLRDLVGKRNDDSIRSNLCKLLVSYEALDYLNYVEIVNICNQEQLDLSDRFIGKYLYNNDILDQFRPIKSSIHSLIEKRENWTKHLLSSLLISGPAGSGKSELMKQIIAEIKKVSEANGKEFHQQLFTIGTEIRTADELKETLKSIQTAVGDSKVRVVAFDEFDKAEFNFPLSFLEVLAAETKIDEPVTFWMFGQSSYPTFDILSSYANSLSDKALRDFLTRIGLGKMNMGELKVSPQQKILTALGYAMIKFKNLESVSKSFLSYFASNEKLQNNRELIADFERCASYKDKKLGLSDHIPFRTHWATEKADEGIRIIG